MTNTIHLPDPLTGEPVKLHVPEDCPYFCIGSGEDAGLVWFAINKLEKVISVPEKYRGSATEKILHRGIQEWLPVIAAVAAEWWLEKAIELYTEHQKVNPYMMNNDEIERRRVLAIKHPDLNAQEYRQYAIAWRRFTVKPKESAK